MATMMAGAALGGSGESTPTLAEVDRHAQAFVKPYPCSSFPELQAHPVSNPDAFREWAKESHQVAVDWAYGVQTVSDPNTDQSVDRMVRNMVKFILDGTSPVQEAPALPPGCWEKLQHTAGRRITLVGYRRAESSHLGGRSNCSAKKVRQEVM
jgi:hypothetical protein